MKKITLLMMTLIVIATACKKDEEPKLTIDQTEISLNHDGTKQLTASMACTWSTSDSNVVTVSSAGMAKGIRIGDATITAKQNGQSVTCYVHVTPTSLLFAEPCIDFTLGKSGVKNFEKRTLLMEQTESLMYEGEKSGILYMMYMFENSHLDGAVAMLQTSSVVAEEAVTYLDERYLFLDYSDDIAMYTNGNGMVAGLTVDDSLGLIIVYIKDSGKKSGSIIDQIKAIVTELK
jgi:hypothetical protein